MKIEMSDQRFDENVMEKCDMKKIPKFFRLSLYVLSKKLCRTQTILFLVFVLFILFSMLYNYNKFHHHDGMMHKKVIEIETKRRHHSNENANKNSIALN